MVVPQFPDRATDITPSSSVDLVPTTVYVGVSGDVTVEPAVGGGTVTFTAVPAGSILPVRVRRLLVIGTTASGFVGVS